MWAWLGLYLTVIMVMVMLMINKQYPLFGVEIFSK